MKRLVAVALIISVLAALRAVATPIYGSVTMSYTGTGASDVMKIWGGGRSGLNVYAGLYMFNKTAGTGEGQYLDNGSIGGFSMDLSEYIAGGSITYDVIKLQDGPRPTTFLGEPMGQAKAAYLAGLWGRFFDPAWAAGRSYTAQQNSRAETFAAAVWGIIYEDLPASPLNWDVMTDSTVGSRGFRATNLDYQTADNWLHTLNGTGPMAQLSGSQDFIVPVPEPASLAIFAIAGFFCLIKRDGRLFGRG